MLLVTADVFMVTSYVNCFPFQVEKLGGHDLVDLGLQ